jgi:hypothetical protein
MGSFSVSSRLLGEGFLKEASSKETEWTKSPK